MGLRPSSVVNKIKTTQFTLHIQDNNMNKLTTEEFIEKAKQVHGDKYGYSLVNYKNAKTKIKIVCKEHGAFEITPNNHLTKKNGCAKCSNKHNYTTEEFIEKAKQVHGDKYDYSLIEYKNAKTKIKIVCKEHGAFKQLPNNHIKGSDCPICKNKDYTTKKFIEKAKQIHGDKYDYSLVNYKRMDRRVDIICKKHGVFHQFPVHHINGKNCPRCANYVAFTTEEFIEKAKQIHGDKYDYSLVNYKNNKLKINIICFKHGIFKQVPSSHLQGFGCSHCNESKGEQEILKYFEKEHIQFERQKTFHNCKNIRELPFDFYLLDKNVLIEYDGEQHFVSRDFFGGDEALKYIQTNDNIKTKYCYDNNIKLIRISYKENIITKLEELLWNKE